MKRIIITTLLVLTMFLLQTSIFNYISFGGIVPNLLLILVSVYGFMRGENSGILLGFFCGLLIDVFYMDIIGFNALLYLYIGYFNGLCNRYYIPTDVKLPIFLLIGSDLISSFIKYIFLFLLNGKFDINYYFLKIIFPELIYTLGVFIILYPLLLILEQKVILVEFRGRNRDAV